ncbi:PTTG1IP family member 2 isoform X1 [Mus musculus]|nr:PTTG1IP family member 2 isoform X1 [Mus musculus]|eukprot:XP_006503657.1 PREDICTED: uncharacterized protein LOC381716 isoform X1 [Mus musculus]
MCWLRAWSHILLPVFLSVALIQLIFNLSDHKTKTHHHWKRKIEAKYVEKECAQKETCPVCTRDKRCIWCREEKVCKKYCFPYSDCKFNSIFWANCNGIWPFMQDMDKFPSTTGMLQVTGDL